MCVAMSVPCRAMCEQASRSTDSIVHLYRHDKLKFRQVSKVSSDVSVYGVLGVAVRCMRYAVA